MSADGPLYLAIDQGGHASRAVVHDAAGHALVTARRAVAPARHPDGRIEYEADAVLRSVSEAVTEAIERLGRARRHRLRGAGLATQRANVVCWDRKSGAPLSPIISWQDRRAGDRLDAARASAPEVRRITGLPPSPHYGAGKLRWCLDKVRDVRAALDARRLAFGPMPSFLLFHLAAGRPLRADPVTGGRTLLWDLDRGDWSPRMLELFGLPRDPLPDPVPNAAGHGTVAAAGARIPLTVMTGDQNAALHADGAPREDTAYVTLGTGAFILRPAGSRRGGSTRLLEGILHDDGVQPTFALEGTVNGAGAALEWLAARHGSPNLITGLDVWLREIDDPPLFINGVAGLGTPFLVPDLPSRFIGGGTPEAQAVAVVESIAFLLQINLEEMTSAGGAMREIHVGGGLSRFDGLCQRIADLGGIPVWRAPAHETTARGLAALLRAADNGEWPVHDRAGGGCWFAPRSDTRLQGRFARWREALGGDIDGA